MPLQNTGMLPRNRFQMPQLDQGSVKESMKRAMMLRRKKPTPTKAVSANEVYGIGNTLVPFRG